jgi:hypothetical protein
LISPGISPGVFRRPVFLYVLLRVVEQPDDVVVVQGVEGHAPGSTHADEPRGA